MPKLQVDFIGLKLKLPQKRTLFLNSIERRCIGRMSKYPRKNGELKSLRHTKDRFLDYLTFTFSWRGSYENLGGLSSVAEHWYDNTFKVGAVVIPRGEEKISHTNVLGPWKVGNPTLVPKQAFQTVLRWERKGTYFCDSAQGGA